MSTAASLIQDMEVTMTQTKREVITHGNYLDRSIIRLALRRARELVTACHTPEAAARLATPGSWGEYRSNVLVCLRATN